MANNTSPFLHSGLVLALAAEGSQGQAPGRIQLFPAGNFSARDGRPASLRGVSVSSWRLTAEDAAGLIARWQAQATPMVIDYEHQTQRAAENGRPAPAAGWITALSWEDGRGLFADVTWTEQARAHIKAGEYRYISPVFTFDVKTGAVLRLFCAALTNIPALDGMDAARATHTSSTSLQEDTHPMKEILEALGLPATADEAAALAALATLKSERDAARQQAAMDPDPQKYVTMATFAAVQKEAATLRAELESLKAEASARAMAGEIEAALKDGRLTAATRTWAEELAKKSPETLKAFLASQPPVKALTQTQTGGKAPDGNATGTAALTEEDRYICKQLGLSSEDFTKARAGE